MAVTEDYSGVARAILARASFAIAQAASSTQYNITPAVAQYQDWTYGIGAARNPLPRDARAFLEGAFGPLTPPPPMPIDQPAPGDDDGRPEPRRFEYPVGWNAPVGRPGTEGLKLATFLQLRAYADMYSLVRAAIEVRKQEILGIEWDIVPTRRAAAAMKGNEAAIAAWEKRKDEAVRFFRRPDPEYPNYQSWMSAYLEDLFVIDAPTLYLHPSRLPGRGVLGSNLAALALIDGSTIRPMLDMHGARPKPPNPGYQQYLWGVPRTEFMQIMTGLDVEEIGGLDAAVKDYRSDQLMYTPYIRRSWTPYGFPGIERALLPVVTGLKKQQFALEFFTEGSIPGMFVVPGPGIDTPEQIKKLQDTLNFLAGDQAWKHKIIVLPHGSSSEQHKKQEIASTYDETVAIEVCMAYEVHPDEIGFQLGKASKGIQFGGSATAADTQDDARKRKATKPLLAWLRSTVFNTILQGVLGQEDMEWSWVGWQDEDEQAAMSERLLTEMKSGGITIDEYRVGMGREPYGFPSTGEPLIISERGIVVPLAHLDTQAIADTINDPQGLDAQQGDGAVPDDAGDGAAPGVGNKAIDADTEAQLAELEKLRRSVKKGRPAAEWRCEHLPEPLVQMIAFGDLSFADARKIIRGE